MRRLFKTARFPDSWEKFLNIGIWNISVSGGRFPIAPPTRSTTTYL
jgi:hypothetical protein